MISMRNMLPILIVVLQCTPLWADEVSDAAQYNATSAPQTEFPWMSGGIGDEARDSMHKAAQHYNVQLVFSAHNGNYLSNVPVTVTQSNGRQVYAGISAGPLLYLKLPPGAYQVTAELDGTQQIKHINASASGHAEQVMFISQDE